MLDLPKHLPLIVTNRSQLEQVLLILCNNAVDALKHLPNPSMGLKFYTEDQFAKKEVIDNDPSMDGTTLSIIFRPFFTTKIKVEEQDLAFQSQKNHRRT